jgi:hypothetical protein
MAGVARADALEVPECLVRRIATLDSIDGSATISRRRGLITAIAPQRWTTEICRSARGVGQSPPQNRTGPTAVRSTACASGQSDAEACSCAMSTRNRFGRSVMPPPSAAFIRHPSVSEPSTTAAGTGRHRYPLLAQRSSPDRTPQFGDIPAAAFLSPRCSTACAYVQTRGGVRGGRRWRTG